MEDIIKLKNVKFSYNDKKIFDKLTLSIRKGSFTSIIGPNGSGKSTLMKLIVGLYKAEGKIIVDDTEMSVDTYKSIRSKIGIVFENPDNQFVAETVMDEIAFALENMNFEKKEIRERVEKVGKLLDIEPIMEKEPHGLSGGQKELVALASALAIEPKVLILDEAMDMIDNNRRESILKVLTDLNKEGLTIINITHNSEELLYGSDIIVMNNGVIVDQGDTKELLRKEKLFKNNGLELPFVVDLSYKLKYYGIVDDIVLDMDELVNLIWK